MTFAFLTDGKINREDVEKLVELTKDGSLRWQHSSNSFALSAYPAAVGAVDDQAISAAAIGENLKGVRLGYNPSTDRWHYLRLTSHGGEYYYLDAEPQQPSSELVHELFALAQKAHRLGGLLLCEDDRALHCNECGGETPHRHLSSAPYGIAGAVLSGSERYTCTVCEEIIPASSLQEA